MPNVIAANGKEAAYFGVGSTALLGSMALQGVVLRYGFFYGPGT
jgi:hypothetical protein